MKVCQYVTDPLFTGSPLVGFILKVNRPKDVNADSTDCYFTVYKPKRDTFHAMVKVQGSALPMLRPMLLYKNNERNENEMNVGDVATPSQLLMLPQWAMESPARPS